MIIPHAWAGVEFSTKKPPKPNKETLIELSIYRKSEQVTRHPKRICVHENILQTLIFQLDCRLKSTAAWWEQGCSELPSKGTILSLWERIFQLCMDLLREFPVDAVHLSLWSTYPQNKKEYWLRSASRKSDIWTPLHQQHPGTGRDLKKLAPISGWLRGTLQVDSEIWVPQAHQGSNVHTGELNCSIKDFLTLLFICILREFFKRWLLEPGIPDLSQAPSYYKVQLKRVGMVAHTCDAISWEAEAGGLSLKLCWAIQRDRFPEKGTSGHLSG